MADDSRPATTYELDFDAGSHSADAIQRAAYVFTNRFALTLSPRDGVWHCTLDFVVADPPVAEIVRDFRIEVLDYVLRERIREETAPVRNAILALAFSQLDVDETDVPTDQS